MGKSSRRQPSSPRHLRQVPATKPPGVLIGYCHPGTVAGFFHDSLMGTLLWDHSHGRHVVDYGGYASLVTGPRIASGRTQLVDAFLNHPNRPEWLWMLDSDMVFHADTLEKLLESADPDARPILGGLCFGGGRSDMVFPTLYILTGEGAKTARLLDYPRDSLVKVDATGAACLLIHRSVFTRMAEAFPRPYPWFQEVVIDGAEYGEDVTFCLRANRLGIPIFVHTGIKIGHEKAYTITEDTFDAYRARQEAEAMANAGAENQGAG